MKEHPIIMQPESVQAIRADRKTQTRRVVTWRNSVSGGAINPKVHLVDWNHKWTRAQAGFEGHDPSMLKVAFTHRLDGWCDNPDDDTRGRVFCRWKVGDRLWVKETFTLTVDDASFWETRETVQQVFTRIGIQEAERLGYIIYRASDPHPDLDGDSPEWKPSIFMPRWVCREVLEITALKVQRLQEISHLDAIAEGMDPSHARKGDGSTRSDIFGSNAVKRFVHLWDSINAKTHPWESNPWVWVPSFRRVKE